MMKIEMGNNTIIGHITKAYPLGFSIVRVKVKHYNNNIEINEVLNDNGDYLGNTIIGSVKRTKIRDYTCKVF